MSELSIPIGLLDTIIAIVVGAIITLIGVIYNHIRTQIQSLESDVDSIHQETQTLSHWAFGADEDDSSGGMSKTFDEQFAEVNERIMSLQQSVESRQSITRHRLEKLVDKLHDEEALAFDREDLDNLDHEDSEFGGDD